MQTYIRPKASGKELLLVTRITVFVFGMFTGVLSIILFVVRKLTDPRKVLTVSHCHFRSFLCDALQPPSLCCGSLCCGVACTAAGGTRRKMDILHLCTCI